MGCNCGKNRANRWEPKGKKARSAPEPGAPQASHRIVSETEQRVERQNAARPPRARQPTSA